jgi:hypothetical protein
MTGEDATFHPGEVEDETHGAGDHGEDHGHDDHGHQSDALGPVDVYAWGAFILGTGLGLVVAIGIAVSTRDVPV